MAGFGSEFYNVGPESGTSAPWKPITPDPTQEYVVTGPGRLTPKVPQTIISQFDDITRAFGFRVFEAMLTDPAVSSSFLSLKLSILDGPLQVQPAIRPKGYRQSKQVAVDLAKANLSPTESKAIEIAEFCNREIKRNKQQSFKSVLGQLLDKMAFGCKLAEQTREEVTSGPDKGKLGLKSITVKPHWSWKFVVDAAMKPQYILTWLPPGLNNSPISSYALIPITKFIHSVWLPRDGDPRGTSSLRAAYDYWNLKIQCLPFYYQHLRRFGSPSLDAELSASDMADRYPLDPTTGLEVTSLPKVDPVQRMTQALMAYQNNSIIVRPAGSVLNVIEPKSNGEAFLQAFDLFDRAICTAIALQSRSQMEAKHGSKADSDSSVDTRGLITAYGKEELGEEITGQLFYQSVLLNFGADDAEEFTPTLTVGKTEHQDKAAMWQSASFAGWRLGPSQMSEVDVMLDAPERDEEADAQAAADQAQQAHQMAMEANPPAPAAPPGGQKGAGGNPATKPSPSKGPVK